MLQPRNCLLPAIGLVFFHSALALGQTATLTLGSPIAAPGGIVKLPLTLSGGLGPAGFQWTLKYPSSKVLTASFADGPALVSAGKSASCLATTGQIRCVASGLNLNAIHNGVVATATLQLASPAPTPFVVEVDSVMASSDLATVMPSTGFGAPIGGTAPLPALHALACGPALIGPGTAASCTVSLTGPSPVGGTRVLLASGSTQLIVPSSLDIAGGALTALFSAVASPSSPSQNVPVTASLNGLSKIANLSIGVPSAAPLLASLNCAPTVVAAGSSARCTVTLTDGATGIGAKVTIWTTSASVTAPSTITIAAGATSGQFDATVRSAATSHSAVVSIIVGALSKRTTLTVTGAPAI